MNVKQKSISERLSQYGVKAPSGCVEWTGRRDRQGYGYMAISRGGIERKVKAHRAAYEEMHGAIPNGACVLHSCDNPPCINPSHLFVGSRSDNHADMVSKGRQAAGTRSGRAKLTADAVAVIRSSSARLAELAANFNVSEATISRVKRGLVYAAA